MTDHTSTPATSGASASPVSSSRTVGLALSGAGSRASFELGVLRYLYEIAQIQPDVITGTSAGAILATTLAQGGTGGEQLRVLEQVEALWRSMTSSADLFEELPWFATLHREAPGWFDVFNRRRRARSPESAASVPAAWVTTLRIVDTMLAVRRLGHSGHALEQALDQAETARSLYRPGRISAELAHPTVLDPARVAASGVSLRIAVVSLESGALRYVTETGELVDRDDAPLPGRPRVALTDAVRASCAVPGVFEPVALAGEHYVDGGVRQMLPVAAAARLAPGRTVYAVSGAAPVDTSPSSYGQASLLSLLLRSQVEITFDELLHKEIELAERDAHVVVIAPQFDVHDALSVDPVLIDIAIDYGWERARDVVSGADAQTQERTRRIAETRRDLHLAGKAPLPRPQTTRATAWATTSLPTGSRP